MKSFVLTVLFAAVAGLAVFAQKPNKAKDLLEKKKLPEAKAEIDKVMANQKNLDDSEAWYIKLKVYNAIAMDSSLAGTVPNARETAVEALHKYSELEEQKKDSGKRYTLLTLDNRQPLVDLYSGYSKDAASYYNAGNFNDALTNFQKTLDIFNFLAEKGWTNNTKLDTTTTLYAGIAAEKAHKLDTAAIYYGKIAESKARGEGYVEIYKWVTDHYYKKGDTVAAKKYLELGKAAYPEDPFWAGYELDMVREGGNKDSLFSKYEEVIKKDPDNHLYHFNYAVELYQTGYNADSTQRPANSKELIAKAISELEAALKIKDDYPNANLVMGQIYYNQGVDISNVNKTIRPPSGGKLKPEELKKKADLRDMMNAKYDEAIKYFDKVDQELGSQGKLKAEEKGFLKDTYDLLISIYEQRQDKDNAAKYTDKFNAVEKVH